MGQTPRQEKSPAKIDQGIGPLPPRRGKKETRQSGQCHPAKPFSRYESAVGSKVGRKCHWPLRARECPDDPVEERTHSHPKSSNVAPRSAGSVRERDPTSASDVSNCPPQADGRRLLTACSRLEDSLGLQSIDCRLALADRQEKVGLAGSQPATAEPAATAAASGTLVPNRAGCRGLLRIPRSRPAAGRAFAPAPGPVRNGPKRPPARSAGLAGRRPRHLPGGRASAPACRRASRTALAIAARPGGRLRIRPGPRPVPRACPPGHFPD